MIKNFKWLLLVSLSFAACNSDDDDAVAPVVITPGSANFSNYVALGDSFAAGYSDNALFMAGQKNAYTNILSQQFALAGGGSFSTPFMSDNLGGFSLSGVQIPQFPTRLWFDVETSSPVNVTGISGTSITDHLDGPFNNMGIPGAKSFHLVTPGYGTLNPYFGRFASSGTTTVIADAAAQDPTFFSLWIGGNDVLAYAISGGSGVDQTGNLDPSTYGGNDITDPNVFAGTFSGLVDNLTTNGAKGVVANLPYVNALPYFTTVPYNPIPGLPASNAAQLNMIFGGINQITTTIGQPNRFVVLTTEGSATTNPLLIVDETLPDLSLYITGALTPVLGAPTAAFVGNLYGRARHATNADFILLPARAIITPPNNIAVGSPAPFNVNGVTYPLQDGSVLTADEVSHVKTATDAYNATIESVANAKGLAFVNTKTVLTQLASGGITMNGYTLKSTYVTGAAFSLDGIHPSPRGYAFIANLFIEAINTKYGSNIPNANIGNYRILYPKDSEGL